MQAMFNPPAPLEFKKSVSKRKPPQIEGIAAMLANQKEIFEEGPPPPKDVYETPRQRHARIAAAKKKVSVHVCGTHENGKLKENLN